MCGGSAPNSASKLGRGCLSDEGHSVPLWPVSHCAVGGSLASKPGGENCRFPTAKVSGAAAARFPREEGAGLLGEVRRNRRVQGASLHFKTFPPQAPASLKKSRKPQIQCLSPFVALLVPASKGLNAFSAS